MDKADPSIAFALAVDTAYSTSVSSTLDGIEALFNLLLLELSNEVNQVLNCLWGRVDVEYESLAVRQQWFRERSSTFNQFIWAYTNSLGIDEQLVERAERQYD